MSLPSRWSHAGASLLLGPMLLAHCGGTTSSKARGGSQTADDESSEHSEAEAAASQCDDGTCFPCADAICPTGYFCDESAAAGPVCEWLPECADSATCSCVLGVVGESCSCDERDGGVYLTCSS